MNKQNLLEYIRSWRTTLTAVFAAIVGVLLFGESLLDNDPNTVPDTVETKELIILAIIALQGFFSRDAPVSKKT